MIVPDPVAIAVTGGLVLSAANQITKQAQDFIAAALGHKGDSIGTILGNNVDRRRKNAESVASKAYLTLLNIGVTPAEIPLKILQPALEAASLEEDPDLQTRWANLLANAADSRCKTAILPSFSIILKELTPRDAVFLDNFYNASSLEPERALLTGGGGYSEEELTEFYPQDGLAPEAFDEATPLRAIPPGGYLRVTLDMLERNGLVQKVYMSASPDSPPSNGLTPVIVEYEVTSLGTMFIEACRPPAKS